MPRRAAGVGAIKNKNLAQTKYRDKGYELAADQFDQMSKQLDAFRVHLEDFARKYRNEIKKNPEFRLQFQQMCASIGVDPLASSKGFWADMLGFGDFYYELAVQIVEVCLALRDQNGGLMRIEDLKTRLEASRSQTKKEVISIDDILRATKTLAVLGNGFAVLSVGNGYLVQSVPGELNQDHKEILKAAEATSWVTQKMVMKSLRWEEERAQRNLEYLVKEGMAWVDEQHEDGVTAFWFPGMFAQQLTSTSGRDAT